MMYDDEDCDDEDCDGEDCDGEDCDGEDCDGEDCDGDCPPARRATNITMVIIRRNDARRRWPSIP
jgi:hypothetical protein